MGLVRQSHCKNIVRGDPHMVQNLPRFEGARFIHAKKLVTEHMSTRNNDRVLIQAAPDIRNLADGGWT